VTEAALLWKRCSDCVVLVSGRPPATDVMGELLVSLGVTRARLQLERESDSTAEAPLMCDDCSAISLSIW